MSSFSDQNARSGGGGWFLPVSLAALVGGVMALAAAAVRLPEGATKGGGEGGDTPHLVVIRIDRLPRGDEVRERLRLLDPTPLFMPVERAGGVLLIAEGPAERPGGDAGAAFPPAMAFPDQAPAREILRPGLPKTAQAAAEITSERRWFTGMARLEAASVRYVEPLEPAATPGEGGGGRVDVYRLGVGERLTSAELGSDPLLSATLWAPMELTVLVNAAGPVAAPVIIGGSGLGEVDDRVRALVRDEVLPRLRLMPGTYRLVAGP